MPDVAANYGMLLIIFTHFMHCIFTKLSQTVFSINRNIHKILQKEQKYTLTIHKTHQPSCHVT